jgi:hypothetical protein
LPIREVNDTEEGKEAAVSDGGGMFEEQDEIFSSKDS